MFFTMLGLILSRSYFDVMMFGVVEATDIYDHNLGHTK